MRDRRRGIYILAGAGTDRVKVGMTTNLQQRLKSLQASSPVDLELVWWWEQGRAPTRTINRRERELHKRWDGLREHFEWFRRDGELAEFIQTPHTLGVGRPCGSCGNFRNAVYWHEGDCKCTCRRWPYACGRCERRDFDASLYARHPLNVGGQPFKVGKAAMLCKPCLLEVAANDDRIISGLARRMSTFVDW